MDVFGRTYRDATPHHPHALESYVGQAVLQVHRGYMPDENPHADATWHSINLAVPPAFHAAALRAINGLVATVSLVPYNDTSGLGILTVRTAPEPDGCSAVLAVLDLAGRPDLQALRSNALEDLVAVGPVNSADPAVTPQARLVGLYRALDEARPLRRLMARELVQAMEDVRALLRTKAAHALLGTFAEHRLWSCPPRLKSITLNVCPF